MQPSTLDALVLKARNEQAMVVLAGAPSTAARGTGHAQIKRSERVSVDRLIARFVGRRGLVGTTPYQCVWLFEMAGGPWVVGRRKRPDRSPLFRAATTSESLRMDAVTLDQIARPAVWPTCSEHWRN